MKRSKHTLSHYRMHTARMGELLPIGCVPVIPGDTFQHNTSVLVRAAPLNTPVMHPVNIRIHHFFVPNRILWDGWENFITGGPDGNDNSTPPTIPIDVSEKKAVTAYLGVPPVGDGRQVNALPLYAYNLIYNEWYRDQDLNNERLPTDNFLALCAWEKDYFTTARPWTQKGPDVTIPIRGDVLGGRAIDGGPGVSAQWESTDDSTALGFTRSDVGSGADEFGLYPSGQQGAKPEDVAVRFKTGDEIGAYVQNATASVNDFREAFALQRYQEARARYGSRFTEYLRYLGITPSDARLQRPEYLGGGNARLNFSEVLQTTPSDQPDTAGVGDLYGHGIAGARTPRYRKFFEEHGYVVTMCSVRPKATYLNGVHREFIKTTKEEYFQKELVHLGQQAIDTREINHGATLGTFGYQDRYDEYRQHWSFVGQDFRDTLSSWHLGRILGGNTALNEEFIECTPSDRIFQVADVDNMWIMANHHIVARRLVPKRARPRIL